MNQCHQQHTNGTSTLSYYDFSEQQLRVEISVSAQNQDLRSYKHTSSEAQRCFRVNNKHYSEHQGQPKVRSGNTAFDAMFALAVDEMKLNSVAHISDPQYNQGKDIDCQGFKTGKEWDFIWTRDLSYAAALSLAQLDPQRVKNSLLFKTSGWRTQFSEKSADEAIKVPQIVQDTGSGGSWPISTDRVCWAFAAEALLNNLQGPDKSEFATFAFQALQNTLETDHKACFIEHLGLYGGEKSFLDWREQSYPSWIGNYLGDMATSCSLSTNVCYFKAFQLTAELAQDCGEPTLAAQYRARAARLKSAINQCFWSEKHGLYSSMTSGDPFQTPLARFDWLGLSLAIITGVADAHKAHKIVENYPHGPLGPPVIYPQQQGVPIYHNRALWPFVTAFGLKAAAAVKNVTAYDAAVSSLTRGAALYISNMENLEWLSGRPYLADKSATKDLSGPVINSEYQLWSVAGYLGMVIDTLFGVQISAQGILLEPHVTPEVRKTWFDQQESVQLLDVPYLDKHLAITLHFRSESKQPGFYCVQKILLNGQQVERLLRPEQLKMSNKLDVFLGDPAPASKQIRRVEDHPIHISATSCGPFEPAVIATISAENKVEVSISDGLNQDVTYQIYRNGVLVEASLESGSYSEILPAGENPCYFATATYKSSGNVSQPSRQVYPFAAQVLRLKDLAYRSNKSAVADGERLVLKGWGAPDDSFETDINIALAGLVSIRLKFKNEANDIDTGITCGVKLMRLRDSAGQLVCEDVIQLPHTYANRSEPALSTPLQVYLPVGRYHLSLHDFFNMSYLQVNETYNGISGAGGATGPLNAFDIYGLQIRLISTTEQSQANSHLRVAATTQ